MCAGAGTSVGIRLSVKSSNQNGISANGSFLSFLSPPKDSLLLVSSLRSNTESEDELDESSGGDVEDELLSELTDNPGTTRGTKLSVLQRCFSHFWSIVALDR